MKSIFVMVLCLAGCVEQNNIPADYHPTKITTHPMPGYGQTLPRTEEDIAARNMQLTQRRQCAQSCMMLHNQCMMSRSICIAQDGWAQANCNIQNMGHLLMCNRQQKDCYTTCP